MATGIAASSGGFRGYQSYPTGALYASATRSREVVCHSGLRRHTRASRRAGSCRRLPEIASGFMRLSARNQLDGVVVRVEHGAVMSTVVVALSGGQEVVSAITKDSAEALGLRDGDAVKVVIKATEVMIGKD